VTNAECCFVLQYGLWPELRGGKIPLLDPRIDRLNSRM